MELGPLTIVALGLFAQPRQEGLAVDEVSRSKTQ